MKERQFFEPTEDGRFAEVQSDATVVWPLMMMGILSGTRSNSNKT